MQSRKRPKPNLVKKQQNNSNYSNQIIRGNKILKNCGRFFASWEEAINVKDQNRRETRGLAKEI